MKKGLDPEQLDYLKTVLGLDRVLVPEFVDEAVDAPPVLDGTIPAAHELAGSARLVVLLPLAPEEFPLRGEAEILIDKMIRAMKLEPGDVMLVTWNESAPGAGQRVALIPEQANGRPILIFGHGNAAAFTGTAAEPGQWLDWNGARALATFAPRELLSAPERKKIAWAHLQSVMKEL